MSIRGIAEVLKSRPLTVMILISKASSHCDDIKEAALKDVETSKVEIGCWNIVGEKVPKEDEYDKGAWIWVSMATNADLCYLTLASNYSNQQIEWSKELLDVSR